MSARKKTRKNAGEGYGYMFHGAFAKKADAVSKEKKTKGAWVKGVITNKGHRYLVMSPRLNPIKRKKKNPATKVHKKFRTSEKAYAFANEMRAKYPGRKVDVLERSTGKWEVFVLNEPTHNPHELLVLGANPERSHSQEITVPPGSTITIRMNPAEAMNPADRFTAAHAIAKGIKRQAPGLIQTERQRRVAGMVRSTRRTASKHKYDWIPSEGIAPGQNPSAAGIREDFTGMPAERYHVTNEPHMPAGDYAQLGKLLILYVKPHKGGQVLEIRARGVTVVSDESARQIWFVGGDQDVTDALPQFGALDRGAGLFELGEARRIDYEQRKEHVKDPDQDHWRHEFGEETDERPTVLFDRAHKRLLLEGGAYEIRREGIVN